MPCPGLCIPSQLIVWGMRGDNLISLCRGWRGGEGGGGSRVGSRREWSYRKGLPGLSVPPESDQRPH